MSGYKPPFPFYGAFAWRIMFVLVTLSMQVLAVERRTLNNAGQQQQQWYERDWKTPASTNSDAVYIDDPRGRPRQMEGSGRGGVGDLDDTASGFGEDDEDSDLEEEGSGSVDGSLVDTGSGDEDGDIALPPKHVGPSVYKPDHFHPTVLPTVPSSPSSTLTVSTTTTSTAAHTLPLTTVKPSIVRPVAPPATTGRPVQSTSISSTRLTTSSALFTIRPTTTTDISLRRRPTTTSTKRPTTIHTTTVERPITSTIKPSSTNDTNKTTSQNFWMRPAVLGGLIGGAVAGLLAATLLVLFVIYRMRKKDEGSYALEEPKAAPTYAYAYQKAPTREFYA